MPIRRVMNKLSRIWTAAALCALTTLPAASQSPGVNAAPGWKIARQAQNHSQVLNRLCGTANCRNNLVQVIRKDWDNALQAAPREGTGAGIRLALPMPDGLTEEFLVVESAILSPQMAAQYPGIRTYRGSGVADPTAILRLDTTSSGLHAMVLMQGRSILIDPYDAAGQTLLSYEPNGGKPLQCNFGDIYDSASPLARFSPRLAPRLTADYKFPVPLSQLRIYRTALLLTSSYVAQYDGTSAAAVAAATTQMNRVNAIYERDLNIRLQISGTVVYTTAASQPFPAADESDSVKILDAAGRILADKIGTANFDVGEGFTGIGGGGVAALGSVCDDSSKGSGSSLGVGSVTPLHWVNLVAHEFGHQFGANHTFNASNVAGCKSTSINPGTAFEPGSGSTTMSYVGLCTSATSVQDLQPQEDLVFHSYSVKEMLDFANSSAKPTAGCSVPPTGTRTNQPPAVTVAATDYIIPAKTPFSLNASATDPDAEDAGNLTFSWEELDLGAANPTNEDQGSRPLFRAYLPVAASRRYFPSLPFVLAGTNNPPDLYDVVTGSGGEGAGETKSFRLGEVLPITDRTMRFRVSVRDNRKFDGVTAGSIGFADVNVRSVAAAGPFQVSIPNGGENWTGGTSSTVTWAVAGTSAAPVSTAAVRISLSTDGGQTFPVILAESVPNTGTAAVTIPAATSTKTARIRIEAVNNVYYDISDANFAIAPGDLTQPLITSVVNSASFAPTLAANTLFSVFGSNFGTQASGSGTTLGGATVTVCGTPAPLSFNSGAGLINGLIPAAVAGQSTCPVVVTAGGKSSPAFPIAIGQQALGIFQFSIGGQQLPVATHADYSVIGPTTSNLKPAQGGETIILWCTGWNQGAANPAITIGGSPAAVAYYGPSGGVPGLCQINTVVPPGLVHGNDSMTVGSLAPFILWVTK